MPVDGVACVETAQGAKGLVCGWCLKVLVEAESESGGGSEHQDCWWCSGAAWHVKNELRGWGCKWGRVLGVRRGWVLAGERGAAVWHVEKATRWGQLVVARRASSAACSNGHAHAPDSAQPDVLANHRNT